ncbi:DNA-directed RNA polymerase subunit L [Candidatus Marsarchaeota archaeon]|jgi:DNA-directed RNA polymerase subunit L|nr:DNA-directed RNA polymerase subunit L [Candidatus Marsarchaeota archaeon]MCL5099628.1 DNA-directed RNA polymerase subunit L [Candidatus Marsarchaeota archaeon]
MEINTIKEEGKELVIEFVTKDMTILDLVAGELLQNDDVEFAGVEKDHPEIGNPRLVIRTSKKKPKEALEKALENIDETFSDMKKSFSKK